MSSLISLSDLKVNRKYVLIEDYHAKHIHFSNDLSHETLQRFANKFTLHTPGDPVSIWTRPYEDGMLHDLLWRFVSNHDDDGYIVDPQEMRQMGYIEHILIAPPR